ncbi:hypothetical protein LBW59_11790 [Ralstonia solanacearum]|uniref:Uncharacterized protein n=1 Tax=Ralstonia solanacearum TaxID=305 RepID=A0AAW5ZN51_RALSL|nr:hypothetical protein [Ralstonia solanacearum]MDB0571451.1 hypothetical protein [Ralstonia solanacearum]
MRICIYRNGGRSSIGTATCSPTGAELARTARSYSTDLHEAPVSIGNPEHDAPAFAWVHRLEATSDALFAELHQVDPTFHTMHREGRFSHLAAAFYQPGSPSNPAPGVWSLRHVAFFGAPPPAVSGLRTSQFCDGGARVFAFNFSESHFGMNGNTSISHNVLPVGAPVDPSRMALHTKIVSYADANGIGYSAAATQVERDAQHARYSSYAEPTDTARAALHRQIELYATKHGISYEAACSALMAAMKLKIGAGEANTLLPAGARVDPGRLALHNKVASHAEAKGIDYASALSEISHTLGT